MDSGVEPLDFLDVANLEFEAPDPQRFPCLRLAEQAARTGGTAPALLNAANEVAVAAFLSGRIPFTRISDLVEEVLMGVSAQPATDLEVILEADRTARAAADQIVKRNPTG
jgi:1-deoxy-D-xylulose-5-phosphate reductoisomerase